MIEVRLATKNDAKQILDIYAPSILVAAISFETEVPSLEEMEKRIETCLQKFPWIVCVVENRIAGYAYASKHRDREAYQWSCECSVYVHNDFKGKGIGKKLYQLLFQILRLQEFRNVYAGITLPNEASVHLHEKCGFKHFADYDHVGYKFGKWHTVGWWKLLINDHDPDPPPPIKLTDLNTDVLNDLFQRTAQSFQTKLTG